MRKPLKVLILSLVAIAPFALGQGCSGLSSGGVAATGGSSLGGPGGVTRCATPAGFSGAPQNIEEAIQLINALPKPVSVSCFLESLKRPLDVNLTNSVTSAQPAFSTRSPRIFIMTEPLLISVVPEGPGAEVVEFSVLKSNTLSIKGEIGFPVMTNLPLSAAYDRIRLGAGTKCQFCHKNESPAAGVVGEGFLSDAVKPFPATKVDLQFLKQEWLGCNMIAEPSRCEILRGLFAHGEVRDKEFPASMPTLNLFP